MYSSFAASLPLCFQGNAGPHMHETGDRDGCHLGGGRGLMGGRRASVHLVLHRSDKRLSRGADFRGGRLPAAGQSGAQETLQQKSADERR